MRSFSTRDMRHDSKTRFQQTRRTRARAGGSCPYAFSITSSSSSQLSLTQSDDAVVLHGDSVASQLKMSPRVLLTQSVDFDFEYASRTADTSDGDPTTIERVFDPPPRPRRRRLRYSDLFHEVARILLPGSTYVRRLQRAKNATEQAARQRSMLLLQALEGADADRKPPFPLTVGAAIFPATDCLHHVLQLQTMWRSAVLNATKARYARHDHPQRLARMPLQLFLSQFLDLDGNSRVPSAACDLPSAALIRFEELVHFQQLVPSPAQRDLDRFCNDTILGIRTNATDVWSIRSASEVMQSLMDEVCSTIQQEARLPDELLHVLGEFVEQLVFGRLAVVCYMSARCNGQNARWRCQQAACRSWSLQDFGLMVDAQMPSTEPSPTAAIAQPDDAFAATIEALEDLPYLVPSAMLAVFAGAIQTLHNEARDALGVAASAMSTDVLLPLLMFALSRAELPYLCSQLRVMQEFAEEGSEAGFYLTTLQAAVVQLMG